MTDLRQPTPPTAATEPSPAPTPVAGRPHRGRVPALDGLRGLAVALVVVYHFAPGVLPAGFVGVDVFFVLSGFLITSLALGEHADHGAVSARDFYVRRARRLLPAAVVTVVVVVAVAAVVLPDASRGTTRGEGVASLLYGANWWSIAQGDSYQAAFGSESPLSHFWSLAVEEQFYVVFPLLVLGAVALLARRRGRSGRRSRTRRLAGVLTVGAGVGALASAALMAWRHDPTRDPSRLYFGTDTRLQAVLVGVAGAGIWWVWGHHLRRRASAPVAAAVAGLGVAALVVVAAAAHLRDGWLYHFGFLGVAVASLLVILAVCSAPSVASRAFEHRALVLLGVASYSVYLWHWPVRVFLTADTTPFDGVVLFVVRLVVTAAAAAVSLVVVERPFRRLEDRRTVAVASVVAVVVALGVVWLVSRPVGVPAGATTRTEAPTVEPTATPVPPLRVLWLGDSVAWTMGGGHLDYPQPVAYDNPFDPARMVIWNKADYSCPLVATPKRTFGVVGEKTGWCVHRDTEWPALLDQYPADVVLWSATLFDTYDDLVDGRWITFGTAEYDQLYLDNLEQARRVATSRGATFVLLGQADPVANPDEPDQESLLPRNVWRWGHLRDLQRRFAERHPDDTRFVDLQPIVCPDDSCAGLTLDDPGLRSDGVHFAPGTMAPIAPQVQAAIERAVGRTP